jgi:hypothetical protein
LSPFTLVKVEPDSESPLLVPESVPPTLLKSTLLFAKVATGKDSSRSAIKNSLLEDILDSFVAFLTI